MDFLTSLMSPFSWEAQGPQQKGEELYPPSPTGVGFIAHACPIIARVVRANEHGAAQQQSRAKGTVIILRSDSDRALRPARCPPAWAVCANPARGEVYATAVLAHWAEGRRNVNCGWWLWRWWWWWSSGRGLGCGVSCEIQFLSIFPVASCRCRLREAADRKESSARKIQQRAKQVAKRNPGTMNRNLSPTSRQCQPEPG